MKICVTICCLLMVVHLCVSVELEYGTDDENRAWKRTIEREESEVSIPTDHLSPFAKNSRFERSLTNSKKRNFTHFYEVSSEVNDKAWPHIETRQFVDSTRDSKRWAIGTVTYVDTPRSTFSILEPYRQGSCNSVWPIRSTVQTTAGRRTGGCAVAQNAGFFRLNSNSCLGNIVSDGRFVRESDHAVNANFGIKSSGKIFVGYLSNEEVKNQTDPFLQLVSGVIWLVKNGTNFVNESMYIESANNEGTGNMNEFVNVLSARTALGHDKEGRVIMAVIEGQTHRRGVNLFELADILIKQGAVNAINLDGGGSATLVEEGILVNHVSDHCSSDPEYRCMRAVSTILCAHDMSCVPQDCNGHGNCVEGVCNCTEPWTGLGCSLQCFNGACGEHGACAEEANRCECEDGWIGELCEHACPRYYYGPNCGAICWCTLHGVCHPSTGACQCDPGYKGERCEEECSEGRYGNGCSEECQCSQNSACDHVLGCLCEYGWEGEHCNISAIQNIPSQDSDNNKTTEVNTTAVGIVVPTNVTELQTDSSVVPESSIPTTSTSHTVKGSQDTEDLNDMETTTPGTSIATPSHTTSETVANSTVILSTEEEDSNFDTFLRYTGINMSTTCVQPLLLSYLPLVTCSVCSNLLVCFMSWLYWGRKTRRKYKGKTRRQQSRMETTARRLKLKEGGFLQKVLRSSVSYEPVSTQLGNETSDSSS